MPKGDYLRETWGDSWTKEQDEWLRIQCLTSVSYRDIANAFNIAFPGSKKSRSAIIGRASRRGYKDGKPGPARGGTVGQRRSPTNKNKGTGVTRASKIVASKPVVLDGLREDGDPAYYRRSGPYAMKKTADDIAAAKKGKMPVIVEAQPLTSVPLFTTSHDECKWPTSTDVRDLQVCGAKATHGAYCQRHARVAYVTMPTRTRNKAYGQRGYEEMRKRISDRDAQWIADNVLDDEVTIAPMQHSHEHNDQ